MSPPAGIPAALLTPLALLHEPAQTTPRPAKKATPPAPAPARPSSLRCRTSPCLSLYKTAQAVLMGVQGRVLGVTFQASKECLECSHSLPEEPLQHLPTQNSVTQHSGEAITRRGSPTAEAPPLPPAQRPSGPPAHPLFRWHLKHPLTP